MTEQYAAPQTVALVASSLEISEFDLFCLAWREWHGSEPDRSVIERDFGLYLDHGTVPFYVINYLRQTLSDGRIIAREKTARLRSRLVYYVPLVVCFILFMYFLLS